MSLFQKSVLNKYLKTLDDTKVADAYATFTEFFHNETIIQNIREDKEEQFQYGFLQQLFDKVLDYTINPNPDYDLTTEFKNLRGAKKADGAILKDGKAVGVIELKSTKTKELLKITDQAFGYKNNHPTCNYIITSNFEKLRFFIGDAVEYIDFDLFTLSETDFRLLYLCLQKDQILSDIPLKIKQESTLKEEDITKKLYKDYSAFKKSMFNDMVANNPEIDKLLLFEKSQKLLDRFLFIFFAEDKGLLPPNSITEIVTRYDTLKAEDFEKPLYDIFKQYFGYIDKGRDAKGDKAEIFGYNGGLFRPDELLDKLIISDEAIKSHALILTAYDFESEVDVNILGHIFEHSLNEIDQMTAELEGKAIDKSKTKRKKDGVFYTPKYITKYIVDNTVGRLADAKKEELKLKEADYIPNRNKATKKRLLAVLEDYRAYLLSLTICDPACGSGAFLNQALDYLIKEHHYIDELQTRLLGGSLVLSDITNDILENNIYGVDINGESVDIARLSLWLRTAQKGRPLTTLNDNIKCGNSLIDDPEVAGVKAFNWGKEFPEVFEKGGFDVVIGNPPYVKLEVIKQVSKQLEQLDFKTYDKRGDLYVLFVEKGFNILRKDGLISYIMPNKWLQAGYGKSLRAYFLTKQIHQLIDFGDIQIFQGATTYPIIFTAKNDVPNEEFKVAVLKSATASDFQTNVNLSTEVFNTNSFSEDTWVISSQKDSQLLVRLNEQFVSLNKFVKGNANYGIKFGLTEAFLIDENCKKELISKDINSQKIIGPILRGRDLKRYGVPKVNNLDNIILAHFGSYKVLERDFSAVFKHLLQYEEKLKKRGQCNGSKETVEKPFKGQHHWLELDNNPSLEYLQLYSKPKIMYQKFQVKPCFIFDEQGLYCNDSMWIIPTDNMSLLGVLNSKMGWWLITKYCTQIQNGCQLIWKYFGQIPIPHLSNELDQNVDNMIFKNRELDTLTNQFLKLLQSKFTITKLSKKLQSWHLLEFSEFLKELKKQKIKLSLSEEAEWMEYFEIEKAKALEIQAEIDKTDKEIDQMVYELYGLTDDEIAIVEAATA